MSADAARSLPTSTDFPMSVEEFVQLPSDPQGRIMELVHGEVRLQEHPSDAHGTIQSRLNLLIGNHVDARMPNCRVVANPGIRPQVLARWNHRVPELGVTCAPNMPEAHATPSPILLVEVLSPSNRRETWDNVPLYVSVPSVLEILLVDSTKVEAHLLRRNPDGTWPEAPASITAGSRIELASIDMSFALADAYRGTHLARCDTHIA